MALIKSVKGAKPNIGQNNYLAENATIVGDVTTGNNCSIWFSSVLRGDVNSITLGNQVNIQDGAVVHCTVRVGDVSLGFWMWHSISPSCLDINVQDVLINALASRHRSTYDKAVL